VTEVGEIEPVTNAGTGTPADVGPGETAERRKRWRFVDTGRSWFTFV